MELGFVQDYANYSSSDIELRRYMQKKLEQTPVSEKKATHTVEKGESLWSIAKEHLGKKNATNAEVQDFMYKIAKLNNKTTPEDFNTLYVDDVLYIPEADISTKKSAQRTKPQESNLSNLEKVKNAAKKLVALTSPDSSDDNYSRKLITKYQKLKTIADKDFEKHGHAAFNYWTDLLCENKNLKFEKSYSINPVEPSAVVIRKKEGDFYYSGTETIIYAHINPDGTVKKISFEAPGFDIKDISFDYEVDENGSLKVVDLNRAGYKKIGKVSQQEYNALKQILEQRINEYLHR